MTFQIWKLQHAATHHEGWKKKTQKQIIYTKYLFIPKVHLFNLFLVYILPLWKKRKKNSQKETSHKPWQIDWTAVLTVYT